MSPLAWHYTVGLKLPLIRESGVLRPTDANIEPGERPVLWFSSNPYWEPTSAKSWGGPPCAAGLAPNLPARTLSMRENAEMGEGLYRFGFPVRELVRWPEIRKRAGIKAWMRNALMRSGRADGSDPAQWYGTLQEIQIEGLVAQQLIDFRYWATMERLQHRNNQLAEIAKLEIRVRALPFEELRTLAGNDRECVNHARHRLTNYHKLLERYDAGDLAILKAIRTQVYNAVAVTYPDLAAECHRQLAERQG